MSVTGRKLPITTENFDDSAAHTVIGEGKSRRYLDAINAKGRALNLSRRDLGRERRINILVSYSGSDRRKTIDRREYLEDRRAGG